jgi:hypothetical protein
MFVYLLLHSYVPVAFDILAGVVVQEEPSYSSVAPAIITWSWNYHPQKLNQQFVFLLLLTCSLLAVFIELNRRTCPSRAVVFLSCCCK